MPEQLLNSLFGIQSNKELPAAGLLKTGNSTLQGNQNNHGENSFLAKLAYSMNNEPTTDNQNSTTTPSELNNISSIEGISHLIDMASMGASTNVTTDTHSDQIPLYQVLNHNIPVEAFTSGIVNNNINNGKDSLVQTQVNTFPGYALTNNQGSSTSNEPNIDLTKIAQEIAKDPLPGLSSTSSTNKLNANQASSKTNEQNVTDLLNKLNPAKIAGTTGEEQLSQSSTTPGKQIAESLNGSNTNLLNVQLDTNKNSSQEQTSAPSASNLNTKINEQNAAGILNKLNPAIITGTTGEEQLSQSSTIPGKLIAESHKGSSTNHNNQINTKTNEQNAAGVLNKINPAKKAGTTDEEQLSQSSTIPGKPIAESHKGSSTNTNQNNSKINYQNTANNTDNPDNAPTIEKTGSGQTLQVSKASDSSANSLAQSNSKLAQTDSSESQKIFDIRPDSAGAIVSKSQENTTTPIINSGVNSVNTDEVLLPLNSSSNNSSFNNLAADTPNEFNINTVNTSQKAEPGKNFTNTLSQINNSTIPFVSLGSDTADNIVQKARLFMEGGKSEIRLQLNPPELGILKLEFEVDNDSLETKITVERSVVKDVIEKDIPRLRDLLSNADIDVGKLDVSLQEKGDEKLSLMDKDLQSGSESDSTKDLQDQDSEFLEDDIDKESIEYDEDSNKINFLV